jgi:hypothetical protein
MSERQSIIPTPDQLKAEIAYHKQQVAILQAHLRTCLRLQDRYQQILSVISDDGKPEEPTDEPS